MTESEANELLARCKILLKQWSFATLAMDDAAISSARSELDALKPKLHSVMEKHPKLRSSVEALLSTLVTGAPLARKAAARPGADLR